MTQTIAILNQKGGVGKTTTALSVATYLQKLGKRVLVVDMDPQGNATSGLGLEKSVLDHTTYELLIGSASLSDSVQVIERLGISIVPANEQLAGAEPDLVTMDTREFRLQKALEKSDDYDFILIDCPPALGLLTINSLAAANWVLIPVQAEYYAMEGLSQLLNVVQRVREGINTKLELLGVVVTMYDGRTTLSEQVYGELKKHFGSKLFNSVIPRNVRLAEAPSYGKTIAEHDKWSKGARAYKQLAKEVNERVG